MLLPKPCLEPAQLGFLEGPPTHTNWIGHGDHEEDPSQTLTEPLTGPRLTHNKMVVWPSPPLGSFGLHNYHQQPWNLILALFLIQIFSNSLHPQNLPLQKYLQLPIDE